MSAEDEALSAIITLSIKAKHLIATLLVDSQRT